MQFDPLDKKIKEAADQHHPAYDEHAWKKMKKLLDHHMPQKERKRRFLFIIPLFLLLGGGIFYFVFQPERKRNGIAGENSETTVIPAPKERATVVETEIPVENPAPFETNRQPEPTTNELNDVTARETATRTPSGPENPGNARSQVTVVPAEQQKENIPVKKVAVSEPHALVSPGETSIGVQPLAVNTREEKENEEQSESKESISNEPKTSIAGSKTGAEPVKADDPPKPDTKTGKKKPAPNRFFVYGSVGGDLSFTKQAGDTRLLAGVGAGFTIRDRITIRSGLFSGRKVYSAGPDEYDPPAIFWNYYPNLEKVDADCKIYELPLLVSFQFGRSPKQSWMATAGISTLFMKEEKYKFYYKPTPTSPTAMRQYTWKNEATHPFSVITISGGYKRNLGKRITVMAEPYLKVPLNGIGYGKVKLNSGGVMVSVGINPF